MWGYHDGWHWGGWLMMSLTMLAFWGLVAWVVVSLVRGRGQGSAPADRPAGEPDAEEILKRRFAEGKIDEDEYRSRLRTLRGGPGPGG